VTEFHLHFPVQATRHATVLKGPLNLRWGNLSVYEVRA
jgi:hypothetical protein